MSELEREQGIGGAAGGLGDHVAQQLQDPVGVVGIALLAGERRQAQQAVGRGRVGRRRRVVDQVLLPHDERLGVLGGA